MIETLLKWSIATDNVENLLLIHISLVMECRKGARIKINIIRIGFQVVDCYHTA
jgi:hypothetical protein